MAHSPLLGPVVTLVAWTLVMLVWMAVTRAGAAKKAGINLGTNRGGRGQDLDGVVAAEAQWKAHNYVHLMEQPTIFYALAFATYLLGQQSPLTAGLAWGYVALRVLHSLIQVSINRVAIRFLVFSLSTIVLMVWTVSVVLGVTGG